MRKLLDQRVCLTHTGQEIRPEPETRLGIGTLNDWRSRVSLVPHKLSSRARSDSTEHRMAFARIAMITMTNGLISTALRPSASQPTTARLSRSSNPSIFPCRKTANRPFLPAQRAMILTSRLEILYTRPRMTTQHAVQCRNGRTTNKTRLWRLV